MALTIDGEQHVRIKLGLFYVIIATLVTAAVYTAWTVSQFTAQQDTLFTKVEDYTRRTDNLEAQLNAMRTDNAGVSTKIAVIETKLSAIESNTREIKEALRNQQ